MTTTRLHDSDFRETPNPALGFWLGVCAVVLFWSGFAMGMMF